MKKIILTLTLSATSYVLVAQNRPIDSLKTLLSQSHTSREKIKVWNALSSALLNFRAHQTNIRQAALAHAQNALTLSRKIQYQQGQVTALYLMGRAHLNIAQYTQTIAITNQALKLYKNACFDSIKTKLYHLVTMALFKKGQPQVAFKNNANSFVKLNNVTTRFRFMYF